MNWFSNIFSTGAEKVIDSLGSAIDKLVTSDEEKAEIKLKLAMEMNRFKESQNIALEAYEKEITKRHANDMKSDSWLSKNIRPLVLLFLTVSTVILAYMTIFILDEHAVKLIDPWVDLLKMLLMTAYGFYFSGRSYEKAAAYKNK